MVALVVRQGDVNSARLCVREECDWLQRTRETM